VEARAAASRDRNAKVIEDLEAKGKVYVESATNTCLLPCNKKLSSRSTLLEHMTMHLDVNDPLYLQLTHKCEKCEGRYVSKKAMTKRMREVHGDK